MVSKGKYGGFAGSKVTSQKSASVKIDISKYGEMSYRFVVKAPEPGEYGFPVKWDVYHFAVDQK